LADEVIGHMVERVAIPTAEEIPFWPRKRPAHSPNGQFEAFRGDDRDLVPPMAHAGEGYRVHFTGLTHDERGYPAMTAEAHQRLVTRLVDKIRCNADDIVRYETYHVEDASVIVVAFGCTARSARKAVRQARSQGIAAGLFRPISLWPFPEGALKQIVSSSTSVIVAEMNLGQVALEVERLLHRPVSGIFHAGGEMIAPEQILEKIKEVALERATSSGRTPA
jgi:2-oxoglutarate ferredoxin oxidoreductase subunit alpha